MRKAEKRRLGAERAAVYLEETKQLGLQAQKLDNKLRAERAAERQRIANKKKAPKVINRIAERYDEDRDTIDLTRVSTDAI